MQSGREKLWIDRGRTSRMMSVRWRRLVGVKVYCWCVDLRFGSRWHGLERATPLASYDLLDKLLLDRLGRTWLVAWTVNLCLGDGLGNRE
jgi:hypothetical protein